MTQTLPIPLPVHGRATCRFTISTEESPTRRLTPRFASARTRIHTAVAEAIGLIITTEAVGFRLYRQPHQLDGKQREHLCPLHRGRHGHRYHQLWSRRQLLRWRDCHGRGIHKVQPDPHFFAKLEQLPLWI